MSKIICKECFDKKNKCESCDLLYCKCVEIYITNIECDICGKRTPSIDKAIAVYDNNFIKV